MAKALKSVRIGIIGVGGMGTGHARSIMEAKGKDFSLSAVADVDPKRVEALVSQYGVRGFADGYKLIDPELVDAVIIATPHYFHPPYAIYAARRGVHVLTEKPMGVTVGAARAMVAECKKHKVALGVMFQQRNRPNMKKMKQLVAGGAIGELFRVQMICSTWYRTAAYYRSGSWRGTWDGEGGGILLNQAPHSLDLFQWIGGMPRRVLATVGTRTHKIEVENTANAILDYGGGKTGYIYATTAEAPGYEQLMVCGTKGTLVAEGGKLRLGKLAMPLEKHLMTAKNGFGQPECAWSDVPLEAGGGAHIQIIQAFVANILKGKPLAASGEEGVNELELSNAIYVSGYMDKAVDLPLDGEEIEKLISKLQKERGTGKGGNLRKLAAAQMRKLLS